MLRCVGPVGWALLASSCPRLGFVFRPGEVVSAAVTGSGQLGLGSTANRGLEAGWFQHQHGTEDLGEERLGGVADDDSFNASSPDRTHDQQVDAVEVEETDDGLGWRAVDDVLVVWADAGPLDRVAKRSTVRGLGLFGELGQQRARDGQVLAGGQDRLTVELPGVGDVEFAVAELCLGLGQLHDQVVEVRIIVGVDRGEDATALVARAQHPYRGRAQSQQSADGCGAVRVVAGDDE